MKLQWRLVARGLKPTLQFRRRLVQRVRQLEMLLVRFPHDTVQLQVQLRKQPRRQSFEVDLMLWLPTKSLRAKKTGPEGFLVLDAAFQVLVREVGIMKSSSRLETNWRRLAQ